MQAENPPPPASFPNGDLPPVEPPSPGFILQLFLVPAILVGGLVALILFFFGWVGGPQTARDFLDGLNAPNELRRWKAAEHLAQVLQRDPHLASDVDFALTLAEMVEREIRQPPPAVSATEPDKETAPDAVRFLAPALGRFYVPVGLSLFQDMILANTRVNDVGQRLRRRVAVWAIALQGERLKAFDALPQERKDAILGALTEAAGTGPERTARQRWAREALSCLQYRQERTLPEDGRPGPSGAIGSLSTAARSEDEMTRKFTVLALANWTEPGAEVLLLQLCGPNDDLRFFEDENAPERGRREIRYGAALALARRGSPFTPTDLVLETLDEAHQRQLHTDREGRINEGAVSQTVLAGLMALAERKQTTPRALAAKTELRAAVQRLMASENVKVRVEAQRVLAGEGEEMTVASSRVSRHTILIAALAAGIVVLLGIGVWARWQRSTSPQTFP